MEIFDLYQKSNNINNEHFNKMLDSKLHIYKDYEKIEYDFEWLDIMEETIRYPKKKMYLPVMVGNEKLSQMQP